MTPLLQLDGVSKSFPGVKALDSISFELQAGEVHVLLGENGAGKSTLVKVLAGAYRPDQGSISVAGRRVHLSSPHAALRLGISTIYQEFNLVAELSAAANIFLGRELRKPGFPLMRDDRRMAREAQALFDSLGARVDASAPVAELSVAQQQMVEIAKALGARARIVLMDEPTATLSELEVARLFAAIRRLQAQGIGVIYISHRLAEARELGNRATILRNGRVVDTVDVARASLGDLIQAMTGRAIGDPFPRRHAEPGDEALAVSGLGSGTRLHDISFTIRRGEIVGLAGLVGAGRTRLARTLFGLEPLDRGRIRVFGQPARIRRPRDAIRLGMAYLPEDRKRAGLVLGLSVRDNVGLAALPRFSRGGQFVDDAAENRAVGAVCRDLHVSTPSLSTLVDYLSGGNQQKVVLAKWLLSGAGIFIFDEPTRGIDVGARVEVYRLMTDLAARGVAILFISSDLPEILGISDRILVMAEGRITAEIDSSEATAQRVLAYAFKTAS